MTRFTTERPVAQRSIEIANRWGMHNTVALANACREADVPFHVACALMEKESRGANVWGNDTGGMFAELPADVLVTHGAFQVFEFYVVQLGYQSNGVGPAQITYRGFFPDMRKRGLKAWVPQDNMLYGLGLLWQYRHKTNGTWESAGTAYNGSKVYGADLSAKIREWRERLSP